jgi:hypothetical protein
MYLTINKFKPAHLYTWHRLFSEIILLAAEIDSGVDIVGGCWQLVGATGEAVVMVLAGLVGLLYPKK